MVVYELLTFLTENFVVIALVVFFLCLYCKRSVLFNIDLIRVDDEFVTCNNKACVRCSKYKETLETAMRKLPSITNTELANEVKECILQTKQRIIHIEQKPNVFFYQCLSSVPIWDKSIFEDTSLLEESHQTISQEFSSLPDRPGPCWTTNNTPTGSWDVFYLINQGSVVDENVRHCPGTMSVINSLPLGMRNNVFSNVMFSVVKPETLITEHYGPTNIRLRCHFGLVVPPDCTLTVGEQTVTWEEGACLVFDDSFLHCVEHAGRSEEAESVENGAGLLTRGTVPRRRLASPSGERAVLIVDLWHPDLSAEERGVIDTIFSPH